MGACCGRRLRAPRAAPAPAGRVNSRPWCRAVCACRVSWSPQCDAITLKSAACEMPHMSPLLWLVTAWLATHGSSSELPRTDGAGQPPAAVAAGRLQALLPPCTVPCPSHRSKEALAGFWRTAEAGRACAAAQRQPPSGSRSPRPPAARRVPCRCARECFSHPGSHSAVHWTWTLEAVQLFTHL